MSVRSKRFIKEGSYVSEAIHANNKLKRRSRLKERHLGFAAEALQAQATAKVVNQLRQSAENDGRVRVLVKDGKKMDEFYTLSFNTEKQEWEALDRQGQTVRGPWALWDTEKGGWMGSDDGPLIYDQPGLAQMAAQVACVRMGWPETRIRPRRWENPAVVKTKDFKPKITGEEAIKRIEEGRA